MPDFPPDRIHIRDLLARCIIGVYPEERQQKQDVLINLTLYAGLARSGRSDDIADTVDYKRVKKAVLDAVESSSHQLIERLAAQIAGVVLEFPVDRVDVCIDKPGALRFARSVAVEISRSRAK
jgi:dihydroneopterin aldolase/D-erythro-7,8-dihydroneopterin triphosphate epimerase